MEIMRLAGLLSVLTLTACQGAGQPNVAAVKNDVPTEWNFNFFTPQALPALVTFAIVQDVDGKVYEFNTLDSTKALYDVVGGWSDSARALNGYWNHIERPPKHIIFCWDSVIDKKVYETRLTLPNAVVEKMRSPSIYKNVQVGLAPEGKVAVWLSGVARGELSYRVTPSVITTLSGDKLELCKGVTRFSNGYEYDKDIKDFIKGKKYPYGNWN
ncbi:MULTISPECIES: DUF2931 family protein [unclassified Serratia (in: enterobacteria)]|uniref:DUF2931 family protein n=1 Tax=unclassified Serratia (in: enterobacteria) TaxID=2647522 RepID=UPI002ED1AABE|nr:DUF2931 family protein [Serratia sp. C2(2)]MEE4449584.1 DUF2931 family protein [Serratia sp. C2(1)]